MPPKRNRKRKITPPDNSANGDDATNSAADVAPLAPPDRSTWPGWVEMESEPAFFNVMLNEMGVRGVKVQEVYDMDEDMLALLPKPIHALIFLFRYRETDQKEQEAGDSCPKDIWFANQVPDFACASVALLNIVNNIDGLVMGKDLRDFRDFTGDMDPMSRGDAIDDFSFVKRIHNSFARETDLLNADMHLKQKAAKAKKKQALAKARETREAKKNEKDASDSKLVNGGTTGTRASNRNTPTRTSNRSTPTRTSARNTPIRTSSRNPLRAATTKTKQSKASPTPSSPLSDPPDLDGDFRSPNQSKSTTEQAEGLSPRRSERQPKPRKDILPVSLAAAAQAQDEDGFHFIAYMPIKGHVWKLDGLDSFPQDLGTYDVDSDNWMNVAQPAVQTRMMMYAGAEIEFNLMAVVHDPLVTDRNDLIRNVKEIQAIEKKLSDVDERWRELDAAVTKRDVTTGPSVLLDISQDDIYEVKLSDHDTRRLQEENDLLKLIDMRREVISRQAQLRGTVRDGLQSYKADESRANHRRHDYGTFVRSWLGALAEQELLGALLENS